MTLLGCLCPLKTTANTVPIKLSFTIVEVTLDDSSMNVLRTSPMASSTMVQNQNVSVVAKQCMVPNFASTVHLLMTICEEDLQLTLSRNSFASFRSAATYIGVLEEEIELVEREDGPHSVDDKREDVATPSSGADPHYYRVT